VCMLQLLRTFSFSLNLLGVPVLATRLLLVFLALATLVEVLDDDADEHVEHEEADEQQERDEVRQTPLVVVRLRLHTAQQNITRTRNRGRPVDMHTHASSACTSWPCDTDL